MQTNSYSNRGRENRRKGFVTEYIDYSKYNTVVTCGPEIMMDKIMERCKEKM